jgi:type IV pilus assembly protein PilA
MMMSMSQPSVAVREVRAARGFTLVEIVIVVAIIGVLAAISFPTVHDMTTRANEPLELAKVEALLHEARTYARRTNQCVEVELTQPTGTTKAKLTYKTVTDASGFRCPTATAITPTPTVELATGMKFSATVQDGEAGRLAFRFSRNGGLQYAKPTIFEVQSTVTGMKKTVKIFPGAGTTRVGG